MTEEKNKFLSIENGDLEGCDTGFVTALKNGGTKKKEMIKWEWHLFLIIPIRLGIEREKVFSNLKEYSAGGFSRDCKMCFRDGKYGKTLSGASQIAQSESSRHLNRFFPHLMSRFKSFRCITWRNVRNASSFQYVKICFFFCWRRTQVDS